MHELKKTKKEIIKLLYQIVFDVKRIFEFYQIKYWAMGGTFLGAVRHQGIIPWDDDADFAIPKTHVTLFLHLQPIFKKIGYDVVKTFFGYKIFYASRKKIENMDYSFPNLDIFVYTLDSSKKNYIQYYKAARETWPKEYYSAHSIHHLKKYNFGSFQIYGPKSYLHMFNRYFGKDWNTVAYREYCHETETEVSKIKVKLRKEDRVPAEPFDHIVEKKFDDLCLVSSRKTPHISNVVQFQQRKLFISKHAPFPIFVIHCPKHKDRLVQFKKYAKQAHMRYILENCVQGGDFTPEFICACKNENILDTKANMSPTEIAISLSHFNTWMRIYHSNFEYGLVLEDDVHFSSDFLKKVKKYLQQIEHIPFDTFYLLNGHWNASDDRHLHLKKISRDVYQETRPFNAGGSAYFISKKCIEKIFKSFFPIAEPQDVFLGTLPGIHLTLKMTFDRKNQCYNNEKLIWYECTGEGGTGSSTQTYDSITVDSLSCNPCPKIH